MTLKSKELIQEELLNAAKTANKKWNTDDADCTDLHGFFKQV